MDMSNLLLHAWICMCLFLHVTMLQTYQAGRFNAARGKPTQQSSILNTPYGSSQAVDGNAGTDLSTCSHTLYTYHTWWAVNLEVVYTVYSVTLTNRGGCCGDRLRNFTIYGSNTGFDPTQVTDLMLCNSQSPAMATGETKTFNCDRGSNNFIDVQYIIVKKTTSGNNDPLALALTLCEVQVEAECPAGSYGSNCLETCTSTCATCDNVNGNCFSCKSGYTGDFCQDICADGTYGDKCMFTCSQNCQIPVCDKFNDIGRCEGLICSAGFVGENCTTVCEAGKYGENCVNDCSAHCKANETCSGFNGGCSGCSKGYNGQTCSQECPDYTYGDSCMYECSPHCMNPCDKTSETGSCGGECTVGYKGDNCTQECVEGDECINNTEEQDENEPTNTNTAVIIAVVVCTVVLVAIIIITAVVFFAKFRRSPPTNPDNKTKTQKRDGNKPHVYGNATVTFINQKNNQKGNKEIPDYENSEINVHKIPDDVDREETPVPSVYETLF